MIVTGTEPCGKTKFRIYLDGEPAFVLYKGEVKKLCMQEGREITREEIERIFSDILYKRARLRAMHLLEDMDRTESGLREKLRQNEYPDEVIEKAMGYVRSYGYIDDVRYAENFILSRSSTKSRKEIEALLLKKGVSKENINKAFSCGFTEDGEQEAIRNILRKKRFDPEKCDREQLRKMYGYLARKGFRYDTIRQVIQNADENA